MPSGVAVDALRLSPYESDFFAVRVEGWIGPHGAYAPGDQAGRLKAIHGGQGNAGMRLLSACRMGNPYLMRLTRMSQEQPSTYISQLPNDIGLIFTFGEFSE